MLFKTKLISLILLLALLSGCASLFDNSKANSLLGGYRTLGASNALLGSYGYKTSQDNSEFQRVGMPVWSDLPVRHVATLTVNAEEAVGSPELIASLQELGAVQSRSPWGRRGRFKVTFLQIQDLGVLSQAATARTIENSQFAHQLLDPQSRFVTTVGLVLDRKWTQAFEGTGDQRIESVMFNSEAGLPVLSVKLEQEKAPIAVNLANFAIVAYQYVRPCWQQDGSAIGAFIDDNGREEVGGCPGNSVAVHPKSTGQTAESRVVRGSRMPGLSQQL